MRFKAYSVLILALAVILTACTGDTALQDINESQYAQMDVEGNTMEEAPGVIPNDLAYHEISLSASSTWEDYHNFYTDEILKDRNVHYFDNLQWASISDMIRSTDFLETAPVDIKKFYIEEALSRDFVNEPSVAVRLLKNAIKDQVLTHEEIGNYAEGIEQRNQDFLPEKSLKSHLERHGEAYVELSFLAGLGK